MRLRVFSDNEDSWRSHPDEDFKVGKKTYCWMSTVNGEILLDVDGNRFAIATVALLTSYGESV